MNDGHGQQEGADAHARSLYGDQRDDRRVSRVPLKREAVLTHRTIFVVNHFFR